MKLKKTFFNLKHHPHSSNHLNEKQLFFNNYTIKPKNKSKTKKSLKKLTQFQLQTFLLKTHSSSISQYNKLKINLLIEKPHNHFHSQYNDIITYDNTTCEHLKKYYTNNESKSKLKKYFHFYKNYLTFFCKPNLNDFFMNNILLKNIEKLAQAFYAKTYNNKNHLNKDNNNNNLHPKKQNKLTHKKNPTTELSAVSNLLFTEGVINEIENNSFNDNNNNNKSLIKEQSLFDISNIMNTEQCLKEINNKEQHNKNDNQLDQTLNISLNLILNIMTMEKPKTYKREKVDCSKNKITNIKPINAINKQKIPLKQAIQNNHNKKDDIQSTKHLVLNGYNNFAFPVGLNKFASGSPLFHHRNISLNRVRLKSNNLCHNIKRLFNSSDSTVNNNNNNNNNNFNNELNNFNIIQGQKRSLSVGHNNAMQNKSKSTSNMLSNLDDFNNNKPLALFGSPSLAPRSRKELTFNLNKVSSNNNWSIFESSTGLAGTKVKDKNGKGMVKKSGEESTKVSDQLTLSKINSGLGINGYNHANLAPPTCLHKYSGSVKRPKSLSKISYGLSRYRQRIMV